MKSRTDGLIVVFPAIIAVLRSCGSFAATTGKGKTKREKTRNCFSVIQKASLEEIQTAILLTLTKRDWIILDQSEGTISAELLRHRSRGKLLIAYDSESISIENLSTDNAGKPHTPVSAIRNLMNDIQKNLLLGFSK
jgi:hypothetical protein